MLHHKRDNCRLCGSKNLEEVLSLTPTPPANDFIAEDKLKDEQPHFPLDVYFCEDCGHVQLLDVVDPSYLFRNYVYVSGTSPSFVKHFEDYADDIAKRYQLNSDDFVFEFGSNDGTLLKFFQAKGARVLGVDPAEKIAGDAASGGIEMIPDFFSSELASKIKNTHGQAKVICANNVFAHIDDLSDIVKGVEILLRDDGVFVFEVSYLVDVYEKTLFDTIYHEHLCYHTVKPLMNFFDKFGMEIIYGERVSPHGGSVRIVAQRKNGAFPVDSSVEELLTLEEGMGLHGSDAMKEYGKKINRVKGELTEIIKKFRAEGKKIAAFGAPAKATTLMYHFDLNKEDIEYIIDDSPLKQGLYSPGKHIPVVSSDMIAEASPDCLILLAWNFADPIIAKWQSFLDGGGCFVVPLPEVKVVN